MTTTLTLPLHKVAWYCYRRGVIVFILPALLLLIGVSQPTHAYGVNVQPQSSPSSPAQGKLLILGLGRVGLQCGLVALEHFDQVVGTVRTTTPTITTKSIDKKKDNDDGDQANKIGRIPFEIESIQKELRDSTHVLWTIPLPRQKNKEDGAETSWQESSDESSVLLQQVLEAVMIEAEQQRQSKCDESKINNDGGGDDGNDNPPPLWTGFLSTTGVYGNHNGAWVTEDSECYSTGNAKNYIAMEPKFQYVFRCAGIYDSTRSALHTLYKDKGYYTKTTATQNVTNRIHSLDIAKAVITAMLTLPPILPIPETSTSTRIYNLADDEPATRNEVFEYASKLFANAGIVVPPSLSSSSKPKSNNNKDEVVPATGRASRRQREPKLVSNQRMQEELLIDGAVLTYPSYREGLQAILKDPSTPWNKSK